MAKRHVSHYTKNGHRRYTNGSYPSHRLTPENMMGNVLRKSYKHTYTHGASDTLTTYEITPMTPTERANAERVHRWNHEPATGKDWAIGVGSLFALTVFVTVLSLMI